MNQFIRLTPLLYKVKVNGQSVPTTKITTPIEGYEIKPAPTPDDPPLGGFLASVHWAAFDVTFPVHKNVRLQVEYNMRTFSGFGFTGVEYILETGAGWFESIFSADIILRLPYQTDDDAIYKANPKYIPVVMKYTGISKIATCFYLFTSKWKVPPASIATPYNFNPMVLKICQSSRVNSVIFT